MSEKFTLSGFDWKKIGIGLLIALGGATLTYVQETIPHLDFGTWTPFVVALNSALVNVLKKYLTRT